MNLIAAYLADYNTDAPRPHTFRSVLTACLSTPRDRRHTLKNLLALAGTAALILVAEICLL